MRAHKVSHLYAKHLISSSRVLMEFVSKTEICHMSRIWKYRIQRSPERTKVWIEPNKRRRVVVVYHLKERRTKAPEVH
ncbi:hypothetical protein HanXRQr2_Chr12g0532871 [Helianthus annuus]|uniref:Uncharacterized protein n=1 Tax=Helianthus annuus TaxID=4232 RepID=A0A9K3HF65_HELAN|nr:hypothetical protein HanXRQr2_Chr12g0532871 [Helianthus annuus]KAJ0488787.1 hypothetical protein HanHA300_Chr12g0436731 [Helianthus annuus]KAJ0492360.1 hypothetical protein HanIR_Chr12g0574021 [Helianthus annuus]KAJ0504624.1 hypothetical protein HanHA89_Chr12g0461371 [Helianthus annuus]KAJ0674352.1 hypothetical protein HanLR1_Chr12g0439011 [Helianthus annuus]